jgi:FkbM family methyltransferase
MNLQSLLKINRLTEIVDVGANPIDGAPPYKQMLEKRLCRVTGFEPQQEALANLNLRKTDLERYLPYAVGDGCLHELRICQASGMTSLFEPQFDTLRIFGIFEDLGRVVSRREIETKTLDSIAELVHVDFLKIDIQGGELAVFKSGEQKLKNCCFIQTEVSFIPLYVNQPIYSEIDLFLRRLGFIPHCFVADKRWIISPMVLNNDPRQPLNQILEADVVYTRNFIDPSAVSNDQIKHMALIAHECYGSFDLTLRCIDILRTRGILGSEAVESYLELLRYQ